jgi:putative DNA primase/helicase
LTHVARIPGFDHRKGEPFRTRILQVNDLPSYTAEQILAEFPPETKPHKPPVSLAGRLVLPMDDPLTCAEEFVKHAYRADGVLCLQYYRGSFYCWTGTHYAEVEVKEVRSKLYEFLKGAIRINHGTFVPFRPTRTKVNTILDALEAGVYQTREKSVPFWIEPFQHASTLDLVARRNGLLNLGTRELLPHDPHLFNINSLSFDYDPAAPTYPELWQAFLRQLWPNDEDHKLSRLTLQEIFGLMLTPDTRHQKIFMIVGPKRSGKGTIGRILTAMLGKDNVANPTLASLSTNFGLSPLIDKRAAIISDARLGPQTNSHTVAERLLSISGEDAITVDRKYRDPWTGKFNVRFLVLTNELPRFTDASGALASRFVLLTLDNSFYGKEDLKLTDRLLTELPGILNWSLRGLERLKKRGHFQSSKSSLQAIRQLEDLASPVGAFLRDWCLVGPSQREDVRTIYDAWWHWCEQHGHKAGSDHVFGRNLHAILPSVIARGRGIDRFYQGVGLSEEGKDQYETVNRMVGRR